MDLTVELVLDFLDQVRKHGQRREPENRKAIRIDMSMDAKILAVGERVTTGLIDVTVKNLSARGIALVTTEPLAAGSEFCLRLPAKTGRPRWIRCTTVRATTSQPHTIGGRFCDIVCTSAGEVPMMVDTAGPLNAATAEMQKTFKRLARIDEILETVDKTRKPADDTTPPVHVQAPSRPECRRAKRARLRLDITAVLLRSAGERAIRVGLRDISTGGIGFTARSNLSVGDLVVFTLRMKDAQAKEVLTRVVRCVPLVPEGFLHGAQLINARAVDKKHVGYPPEWRNGATSPPAEKPAAA